MVSDPLLIPVTLPVADSNLLFTTGMVRNGATGHKISGQRNKA